MTRSVIATLAVFMLVGCGSATEPDAAAPAPPAATSAAPSSAAPSAAAEPGIVEGEDPEVDAVVTAWTSVFDSAVPVEDKLEHLAEPDAARATLEAYAGAGEQVGGISLAPTEVTVEGESATVIYDVLFGGTAAYSGQDGTVNRAGDGWVVPTDQFCSFMAAARTPCPA